MQIETERLILRRHEVEDYERFWSMINDPIAKQFTGGVTLLDYEHRFKVFCEDIKANFSDNNIEFAVVEKSSMKYIGYCGFRESEEFDEIELFYGYCRDSWGKGYGYEAANSAVQYFFNSTKHNFIVSTCNKENVASIKILKRLGYKFIEQINLDSTLVEKYGLSKQFIID